MSSKHTPADFRRIWAAPNGAVAQVYCSVLGILERGNREVTALEKIQPEVLAAVRVLLESNGWTVTGDADTAGRWIIVPAKPESNEGVN